MEDFTKFGLDMFVETNIINPSYANTAMLSDYVKDGQFNFTHHTKDEYGHDLIINIDGHRSPHFIKSVDILGAGCSQTFGTGLPEDNIWLSILAKNNNKTYNNISYRGGSPFFIVENLFKYFKKYGHPKQIFCIFPDFYRIRTYVDKNILLAATESNLSFAKNTPAQTANARAYTPQKNQNGKITNPIDKYIKIPTAPEKIFSLEFAGMLNLISISMLEQYCRSNNIKLIWTIWSKGEKEFFEYCNEYFEYYEQASDDILGLSYHTRWFPHTATLEKIKEEYPCHSEYEDEYFHIAKDDQHYGKHWHLHVAEFFEKFL